jgi:hypothetical protein
MRSSSSGHDSRLEAARLAWAVLVRARCHTWSEFAALPVQERESALQPLSNEERALLEACGVVVARIHWDQVPVVCMKCGAAGFTPGGKKPARCWLTPGCGGRMVKPPAPEGH